MGGLCNQFNLVKYDANSGTLVKTLADTSQRSANMTLIDPNWTRQQIREGRNEHIHLPLLTHQRFEGTVLFRHDTVRTNNTKHKVRLHMHKQMDLQVINTPHHTPVTLLLFVTLYYYPLQHEG